MPISIIKQPPAVNVETFNINNFDCDTKTVRKLLRSVELQEIEVQLKDGIIANINSNELSDYIVRMILKYNLKYDEKIAKENKDDSSVQIIRDLCIAANINDQSAMIKKINLIFDIMNERFKDYEFRSIKTEKTNIEIDVAAKVENIANNTQCIDENNDVETNSKKNYKHAIGVNNCNNCDVENGEGANVTTESKDDDTNDCGREFVLVISIPVSFIESAILTQQCKRLEKKYETG